MFKKIFYLCKLDYQRDLKRYKNMIAGYKQELTSALKLAESRKQTNGRMRKELNLNKKRNELLLEKYYQIKDILDGEKYKVLNDWRVVAGGVDELERLDMKNEKQLKKIRESGKR